jgi:hypothetical protein
LIDFGFSDGSRSVSYSYFSSLHEWNTWRARANVSRDRSA